MNTNKLLDFVGRHLSLIGILLLTAFVGTAASLYFDVPGCIRSSAGTRETKATLDQYACPMHPEIVSAKPSSCPKCGMELSKSGAAQPARAGCETAGESKQHGCCGNPQAAELNLPPGHPPIAGQQTHAGCGSSK